MREIFQFDEELSAKLRKLKELHTPEERRELVRECIEGLRKHHNSLSTTDPPAGEGK